VDAQVSEVFRDRGRGRVAAGALVDPSGLQRAVTFADVFSSLYWSFARICPVAPSAIVHELVGDTPISSVTPTR